ncbi:hypothetical protein [Microbacterium sp. CJ88]|uniref:hypothetical protein n=1 Tax=Microbacterium sp. CJ88 TaxID=3445672 RepID=UPI003F65C270
MNTVTPTTPAAIEKARPQWATSPGEDRLGEDGPSIFWSGEIIEDKHFKAYIFREDPVSEDGRIAPGKPELSVWIDRNDELTFALPTHAAEASRKLASAAQQFAVLIGSSAPVATEQPASSMFRFEQVPEYLKDLDPTMPWPEYGELASERANAYDCGVPGCIRTSHTWGEPPTEWIHELEVIRAGKLELDVWIGEERTTIASVYLKVDESLKTEDELLALAAELKSYATIIEKRATSALEMHRTAVERARRS